MVRISGLLRKQLAKKTALREGTKSFPRNEKKKAPAETSFYVC